MNWKTIWANKGIWKTLDQLNSRPFLVQSMIIFFVKKKIHNLKALGIFDIENMTMRTSNFQLNSWLCLQTGSHEIQNLWNFFPPEIETGNLLNIENILEFQHPMSITTIMTTMMIHDAISICGIFFLRTPTSKISSSLNITFSMTRQRCQIFVDISINLDNEEVYEMYL